MKEPGTHSKPGITVTPSPSDELEPFIVAQRIARPAASLAILSAVGLLLTVAWQLSIAALYGTSQQLDAFWIALALPKAVVDSIHLGLLTLVFILIFNSPEKDDSERRELASSVANLVLGGTLLVITALILGAPFLAKWMGPGLAPELQMLSARMMRLLGFLLIPTALTGVFAGILHAHQKFVPFAVARVFSLAVQVFCLYFLALYLNLHLQALVWSTLVGAAAMLAFCLPGYLRTGFRYVPVVRWRSQADREVFRLFATLVAFSMLDRLNQVCDRFFASLLEPGSISALEFGWRFEMPIAQVLSMSVALPSLAIMAGQAAEEKWIELRGTVSTGLRLLTLAVLPVVGFLVVLRGPLTMLWFQRGEFSADAARLVSSLIPYLGVIFLMKAFGTITVYALLSVRKLRALLGVLSVEVIANAGLNLLLVEPLGLQGVVLATALAMVVSNLWLGSLMLKTLHRWSFASLGAELGKPLAASLGSILFLAAISFSFGVGRAGQSHLASMIELGAIGLAYLLVHVFLCTRLGLIELRLEGGRPRLRLGAREWSPGAVTKRAESANSD